MKKIIAILSVIALSALASCGKQAVPSVVESGAVEVPTIETPVVPATETPAAPIVDAPVVPVVETPVAPTVETPTTMEKTSDSVDMKKEMVK